MRKGEGVTVNASADPASARGRYFPTPHLAVGGFPFAAVKGGRGRQVFLRSTY